MSSLSVFETHKPATVVASPIFLLTDLKEILPGSKLEFEVLDADAAILKSLVGERRYFVVDGQLPTWATLQELVFCKSIHPGLAYLRDKSTLRGVLEIIGESASRQ